MPAVFLINLAGICFWCADAFTSITYRKNREMRRYLVVEHWALGTYTTDDLRKKDLLDHKSGSIRKIIDLESGTFFDPENNEWLKVESK